MCIHMHVCVDVCVCVHTYVCVCVCLSQKEVLHDFMVIFTIAVWQEAGGKHYDGVNSVAIVTLTKSC